MKTVGMILTGVTLGIGTIIPWAWWAVVPGLVLFLYLLSRSRGIREAAALSSVAGITLYLTAFWPLYWSTLPLTWLGVHSAIFGVLFVSVAWILTALVFGVTFAVFMTLAWHVARDSWRLVLAVPAALVLLEWAGPFCYSIVFAGAHSLIGPDYTIGSFAYLLAADPVTRQLAALGGVYAMAAALGFITALVVRALRADARERTVTLGVLAACGALWLVGYAWVMQVHAPEGGTPLPVALVNTYESPSLIPDAAQLGERYARVRSLVAEASAAGAQLIALPEDSRFLETARELQDNRFLAVGSAPVILGSATVREGETLYSRIEYLDTRTGESTFAYKHMPMAFGEYLPYAFRVLGGVVGQNRLVNTLLEARGFSTKSAVASPTYAAGVPLGTLLCEEELSPRLYREEVRGGATVLVNLASHAWFHDSYRVGVLARRVAQVRATETHRYLIRAADAAPAFVIDPYGRVVAESGWGTPSVLYANVYQEHGTTPFVRFGAWLVWCALGTCMVLFLLRRRNK